MGRENWAFHSTTIIINEQFILRVSSTVAHIKIAFPFSVIYWLWVYHPSCCPRIKKALSTHALCSCRLNYGPEKAMHPVFCPRVIWSLFQEHPVRRIFIILLFFHKVIVKCGFVRMSPQMTNKRQMLKPVNVSISLFIKDLFGKD